MSYIPSNGEQNAYEQQTAQVNDYDPLPAFIMEEVGGAAQKIGKEFQGIMFDETVL